MLKPSQFTWKKKGKEVEEVKQLTDKRGKGPEGGDNLRSLSTLFEGSSHPLSPSWTDRGLSKNCVVPLTVVLLRANPKVFREG